MWLHFKAFTSLGDSKNVRRDIVVLCDDDSEAERLRTELTTKSGRILKNEIEGQLIDLYSFGFILDVGCGSTKRGHIGVDLEKSTEADVVADAANLPFKDNSFDCVVSNHLLEHIDDFKKALIEMKRVAKSSVIIVIPRYEHSFVHPGHKHHFKASELESELVKSFVVEDVFQFCCSYMFICNKWKAKPNA